MQQCTVLDNLGFRYVQCAACILASTETTWQVFFVPNCAAPGNAVLWCAADSLLPQLAGLLSAKSVLTLAGDLSV